MGHVRTLKKKVGTVPKIRPFCDVFRETAKPLRNLSIHQNDCIKKAARETAYRGYVEIESVDGGHVNKKKKKKLGNCDLAKDLVVYKPFKCK